VLPRFSFGDTLSSKTISGGKTMSKNPGESAFENVAELDCDVCGATHDEEIHAATLSIHRWFQHQVTHVFEDDALYLPQLVPKLAAN
jgi:hypothetical protein